MSKLAAVYPDAHCELNFSSPFELLIATILSAQCTDKQVNKVTESLFRKYATVSDYTRVRIEELEDDIRRIGLFRSKARNIQGCCRKLLEDHGGLVPSRMTELMTLGGVGRKTANVVLGTGFGISEGIVVDTHVARLAIRIGVGLRQGANVRQIEGALMELVPKESWTIFSHWLIWHGRKRCSARSPRCSGCDISSMCQQVGLTHQRVGDSINGSK